MLDTVSSGEDGSNVKLVESKSPSNFSASPLSMVGGDLHWLWKPYALYQEVDYVRPFFASLTISSPSNTYVSAIRFTV